MCSLHGLLLRYIRRAGAFDKVVGLAWSSMQSGVAVSSCSDARFLELEIAAKELAVRWPIRTRSLRMLALSSQATDPIL
jgi:hypothetical protein